jgi:hypothetical protein
LRVAIDADWPSKHPKAVASIGATGTLLDNARVTGDDRRVRAVARVCPAAERANRREGRRGRNLRTSWTMHWQLSLWPPSLSGAKKKR